MSLNDALEKERQRNQKIVDDARKLTEQQQKAANELKRLKTEELKRLQQQEANKRK